MLLSNRLRFLPLLLAVAIASPVTQVSAAEPPVLPPAGHPRVMLRPGHLPAVKASRHDPALRGAWAELRERASLPADYQPAPRYDLAVRRAAEAASFLAMLDDDRALARRAVEFAFTLLGGDGPGQGLDYFGRQRVGACLFAVAQVYDWCYDAITPEERRRFCALMREHATVMEIGFPPREPGSITGHSSGAQLLQHQLAMAIATFDEDPEIYRLVAGRFYREYTAARDLVYLGSFHHQGSAYGPGRFSCEWWAALLLTRMGAPAPWSLSAMSQVPYYFLYLRRPDGGLIMDGDDYIARFRPLGSYWTRPVQQWLNFTALFRDPQFAGEWRRGVARSDVFVGEGDDTTSPVLAILLRPDRVPAGDLAELPLSRYFPEPLGAIVARTGWNIGPDSRDVAAYMKIGTHHFDNHQHADAGQFQLFYRGALALDSGIYQSKDTGYAQPHHVNYARRTVAHNTLLIEDPDEAFTFVGQPIANDAGQRAMEPAFTMEEFWSQPTRKGRMLARFIGPDPMRPEVSLIKGDLTEAYAASKARRVSRTMAFLPLSDPKAPAVLVVLDRVESVRGEQRKVALLHSMEEPRIEANVTTVTRTGPQVEIAVAGVQRSAATPEGAELGFNLRPLAGAQIRKAELAGGPGWGPSGNVTLVAAGQPEAKLTTASASPEVTGWLQAALRAKDGGATLVLTGLSDRQRAAILSGETSRPLYLRAWVEAAPMAGKLVQTTLLPACEQLDLRKVGGPGQEFVAGGRNWPATSVLAEPMGATEPGAWRVEIGDKSGRAATRFLNVYQVLDTDATAGAVRLVQGEGAIGVSVGARMLIASEADAPLAGGASFEVTAADVGPDGLALVAITDLPAGDHSLWQGEALAAAGAVETGVHTWVVSLRAGRYDLKSR